jgi:cytochrome c biogenesis protein CcmG/thiol:disulfide interchange protein DsbE
MNLRAVLFLLIPLVLAVGSGLGVYFVWGAFQPSKSDPQGMPTRLYGRRIPGFRLPGLIDQGFNSVDLINNGKPVLLVFWAAWSAACMQQHPVLLLLKDEGVPVWGIAYRDKRDAAADFLERNTDPFERIAFDGPGRVAVDFGMQMVPETYLVDGDGFVRWHMVGPLTQDMVTRQILPLIRKFSS